MSHRQYCIFAVWPVVVLHVAVASAADSSEYDPKFDPNAVSKWQENPITLPAFPDDPDLVEVPMSSADSVKLYLDRKSLTLDSDRVSRFVAVVRSPSGARSVFYDGIRCETRETKTYAIGGSDKQWRTQPSATWQFINAQERNGFRYRLFKFHLCDVGNNARAPTAVLRDLTYAANTNE